MEELAKQLGITTVYATATYAFFHWLDENASDEAKAMLAVTMRFKDYKNEQVASALVEQFDRIYTYPLLRWRTFFRSILFTTVVSGIFLFEFAQYFFPFDENDIREFGGDIATNHWLRLMFTIFAAPILLFNVLTDYLSLFVIRPLLVRSGAKPVIGLVLGTVSGVAIVFAANTLRTVFMYYVNVAMGEDMGKYTRGYFFVPGDFDDWGLAVPALAVFVWLLLFALGILIVRLLTPVSWMVGRMQWFLREGTQHPLKAIGYVAAVVVFIGTVAARAVFTT